MQKKNGNEIPLDLKPFLQKAVQTLYQYYFIENYKGDEMIQCFESKKHEAVVNDLNRGYWLMIGVHGCINFNDWTVSG